MGRWGLKVLNFLVKIYILLFAVQTSRNVLKHTIHKWGGHIWPFNDALRPQGFSTVRDRDTKKRFLFGLCPKRVWRGGGGWVGVQLQSPKKNMNFELKNALGFKKVNAPNSLKSKINITFIFTLAESLMCAVRGWSVPLLKG